MHVCIKILQVEHLICTFYVYDVYKLYFTIVNIAVIMPNEYFSIFVSFYFKFQHRQTIHKGQRGSREASGTPA